MYGEDSYGEAKVLLNKAGNRFVNWKNYKDIHYSK